MSMKDLYMVAFFSPQASCTSFSVPALSALYKKWMALWWLVDLVTHSVNARLDITLSLKYYHESSLDLKKKRV